MKLSKFRIPFSIILITIGIVLGIEINKVFSDDNVNAGAEKFKDVLIYTENNYLENVDTQKLVDAGYYAGNEVAIRIP